MNILIIIGELLILFLLTRHLINIMYTLFRTVFRSRRISIYLITILFLPGTIIHELAHWITAEILRVPTGEISFLPQIESKPNGTQFVKLGHVAVAQTDPLRKYLIGLAPIFAGVFFLFLVIWLTQQYVFPLTDQNLRWGLLALAGYLLFTISNNMFSSSKDLEGFIFVIPILVIIGVLIYLSGIQITLTGRSLALWQSGVTGLTQALGIVIGVNVIILMINGIFLRGLQRINHK